jgi:hypothetical protein
MGRPHNRNDIEHEFMQTFNKAKDKMSNKVWEAMKKAVDDAYRMGVEAGKRAEAQRFQLAEEVIERVRNHPDLCWCSGDLHRRSMGCL